MLVCNNCPFGQVQIPDEVVKISCRTPSGAAQNRASKICSVLTRVAGPQNEGLPVKTSADAGGPKRLCSPSPRNPLVRRADTRASLCQTECQ